MHCYFLLLVFVFISPAFLTTHSLTGSVELDEISFDKVINKFEASLVKFDVAFPYGQKQDSFVAFAKDTGDVDELLVAEVGVKDYGEKDNEALAKKYGATKDNFPLVKLFLKGESKPLLYDGPDDFTSDDLRHFVREKTGMYLSWPGCVKELDKLAIKFMKANKDDQEKILKETIDAQKKLTSSDAPSGKIYKTIMEKIIEKGVDFVGNEYQRVKKILSGKISEEKKTELGLRINILQTFQQNFKQNKVEKEEL